MKNDCLHIRLNELADLLIKICSSIDSFLISDKLQKSNLEDLSDLDDLIYIGNSGVIDEDIHTLKKDEFSLITENSLTAMKENLSDFNLYKKFKKAQQLYSTLSETSSAVLLAATIQGLKDSESIETFHPDSQNQKHKV